MRQTAAARLVSRALTLRRTVYYSGQMLEIRQTAAFRDWLLGLRDLRARTQILRRIDRAEAGNLGDVEPVGEGVSEMRIHQGPGYRVYFVQRGQTLILLLCGGDKSSQPTDIRRALQMARDT